ncbi:hypothetical protein BCR33DRAFT_725452 [Rhizoclosmatium globosum]|uniref:Uncharacterized protein n=1 Tax=Rhizoclosmatium globosum TaxID=329046 RepID=A0A1Y2AYC4_9FUNG|nr:hypothetical protein BCR33DRAFT_725452 [Rhizoclosmatium globosum]|eukprot:ORY27568.1 hypothetical protein BCR33DRAFT_725452 [Rhizoclosmatium globosum]
MSTEITRLQLSQPNQMTEPRVLVNAPAPPPPPSVPYSMDMLPISAAGFISGIGGVHHQPHTSQTSGSGVVGDQDLFSAFFVNNSGHTSSC